MTDISPEAIEAAARAIHDEAHTADDDEQCDGGCDCISPDSIWVAMARAALLAAAEVEEGDGWNMRQAGHVVTRPIACTAQERVDTRHRIERVIDRFTADRVEWSPHNPDDVKDLARLIRNDVFGIMP